MLEINGKIEPNVDKALAHFEPYVRHITNALLGQHNEKEDCRQVLRLKAWELFKNEKRIFNPSYVKKRLKWDVINFINRDDGYNWAKLYKSFSIIESLEHDDTLDLITYHETMERDSELEDLIKKSRSKLTQRQYEALIVFLSGADSEIIKKYVGTRSKNLTRYYISLGDALDIVRKVANSDDETPRC